MRNLAVFIFLLVVGCTQAQNTVEQSLDKKHQVLFLGEEEAAEAILQDEAEGFFDKVTQTEMGIQMHEVIPEEEERAETLDDFRSFLKTEVLNFTKEDQEFVEGVMDEAFHYCNDIHPSIFPERIRLIKIKTNHYGPSVYYTREDIILIPADVLKQPNASQFLDVMLHEIFHVYSRYHPEQKKELYGLIGFQAVDQLEIPEPVADRMLYNPDGINLNWTIQLDIKDKGKIWAIPAIVSTYSQYRPALPMFFGYLRFGLFEATCEDDLSRCTMIGTEDGFSTLDNTAMGPYFKKIKDNTQYIIHPDEIMADNFVLVVMGRQQPKRTEHLSEAGKELLKGVEEVLIP
jgi:hypothetical protein